MCMGTNINNLLKEKLKNENFKKEWDLYENEYKFYKFLIDARKKAGLTQKELSQKSGIAQSEISKIENGKKGVTVDTLEKLAHGMGKKLVIDFV